MKQLTNLPVHLALAGTMMAGLALPATAMADETKSGTISVSATGRSAVPPDMAVINLSVVREGKSAREALTENSAAMDSVLRAMKARGIEDKDLQTTNFNIQPRYFYPKRSSSGEQKPPQIVGYIVSNGLTVRIRDMGSIGEILDQSVTLGVNSGGQISFQNADPEAALADARVKAMEAAIKKAKTLTGTAGVDLGRILNISEQNRGTPRPQVFARAAKMESDAAMPVPAAGGENSYSITVNVQWEIKQ